MQIRRLTPALGAEITGLDLSADFDNETLSAVHDALVENQVLVIPAPDLTPEQHISPSARWLQQKKTWCLK